VLIAILFRPQLRVTFASIMLEMCQVVLVAVFKFCLHAPGLAAILRNEIISMK
jgi:hypothetical protein